MNRARNERWRRLAVQYLEMVARQTGMSDSELGRRAGVAASTISRPKREAEAPLSFKTIAAVSAATGIPLPDAMTQFGLENGGGLPQSETRPTPTTTPRSTINGLPGASPVPFGARDLPVLGRAQGGSGVVKIAADERPIDWTFRPAELAGVADAYAVYVVDDSLAPIYEHGDLVYVHPGWPLRAGKVVLVQLDDDTAIVKLFVSQSDKELRLRPADPKRATIVYPRTRVRAIHRVIGGIESR